MICSRKPARLLYLLALFQILGGPVVLCLVITFSRLATVPAPEAGHAGVSMPWSAAAGEALESGIAAWLGEPVRWEAEQAGRPVREKSPATPARDPEKSKDAKAKGSWLWLVEGAGPRLSGDPLLLTPPDWCRVFPPGPRPVPPVPPPRVLG